MKVNNNYMVNKEQKLKDKKEVAEIITPDHNDIQYLVRHIEESIDCLTSQAGNRIDPDELQDYQELTSRLESVVSKRILQLLIQKLSPKYMLVKKSK